MPSISNQRGLGPIWTGVDSAPSVSRDSDFGKGKTPGEVKDTGDGNGFEVTNTENGKTTITYFDKNGNFRKDADVGAGENNKTDVNGQRSWKA